MDVVLFSDVCRVELIVSVLLGLAGLPAADEGHLGLVDPDGKPLKRHEFSCRN